MHTEVLDQETIAALRELSDDDSDLIAELVDVFMGEAPSRMQLITDSLKNGDMKQVAFGAHKLRGGAQALGAFRLGDVLDDIESAARRDDAQAIEASMTALRKELEDASDALRALAAE
jgi:HPt (histidine-containing phosphotransfer) domain-containing protein